MQWQKMLLLESRGDLVDVLKDYKGRHISLYGSASADGSGRGGGLRSVCAVTGPVEE